jgi:hypothetical protein
MNDILMKKKCIIEEYDGIGANFEIFTLPNLYLILDFWQNQVPNDITCLDNLSLTQ